MCAWFEVKCRLLAKLISNNNYIYNKYLFFFIKGISKFVFLNNITIGFDIIPK